MEKDEKQEKIKYFIKYQHTSVSISQEFENKSSAIEKKTHIDSLGLTYISNIIYFEQVEEN